MMRPERIVQMNDRNGYLLPYARKLLAQLWSQHDMVVNQGIRDRPVGLGVRDATKMAAPLQKAGAGPRGETILVRIANGVGLIFISGGVTLYAKFVEIGVGITSDSEDIELPHTPPFPLHQAAQVSVGAFDRLDPFYISRNDVFGGVNALFTIDAAGVPEAPDSFGLNVDGPGAPALQAQSDFNAFKGPSGVLDTYSGTYKNFDDQNLNTEPRAAGSHSYSIVHNAAIHEYLVTHALNKTVYDHLGNALGTGLSPAVLAKFINPDAILAFDAPDGDTVAGSYSMFAEGDRMVMYRLELGYTHNAFSGSTAYAPSRPDALVSATVKGRYEYVFVPAGSAPEQGYMQLVSATAMNTALTTVRLMGGVTATIDDTILGSLFFDSGVLASGLVEIIGEPASEEEEAAGTLRITSVVCAGIQTISSPVVFSRSKGTTASLLASAINDGPSLYRAEADEDLAMVTIFSPVRTGAEQNGESVVVTGTLEVAVQDFTGGVSPVQGEMRPIVGFFLPKRKSSARMGGFASLDRFREATAFTSPALLTDAELVINAIYQADSAALEG
jgi:hypothetical protein